MSLAINYYSNAAVHYTSLSNAGVGLAEVVRELIMLREQVQKLMRIGVNNGLLNRRGKRGEEGGGGAGGEDRGRETGGRR